MRNLIAVWKLIRVGIHLGRALWVASRVFPGWDAQQRHAYVESWTRAMLSRLAIRLEIKGTVPVSGPLLMVSNHISWLDIGVIHAAKHCRFVSKADVQHWPIVGVLARACETLFIERESRRDALRVVHHMAEGLRDGDILAVFPEGTTGDGSKLLPFHANLLQAAIAAGAPVQPVALQFLDGKTRERSFAPCYIGDDTLLGSLWRTLCTNDLIAEVSFGQPQNQDGRDRRAWAADLRRSVAGLRGDAP